MLTGINNSQILIMHWRSMVLLGSSCPSSDSETQFPSTWWCCRVTQTACRAFTEGDEKMCDWSSFDILLFRFHWPKLLTDSNMTSWTAGKGSLPLYPEKGNKIESIVLVSATSFKDKIHTISFSIPTLYHSVWHIVKNCKYRIWGVAEKNPEFISKRLCIYSFFFFF